MPKNTNTEIKDLGFTKEMFKQASDAAFDTYIAAISAEQAKILEGRLGSTTYAAATSPEQDYVKRAEKALVAAEMVGRRINIILNNISGAGQEIETKNEDKQRDRYLEEAETFIDRLVSGVSADSESFAAGVLETSHFETVTTLGGLEL